ncbi:hypothetical protein L0668_07165 [Paraglaciecola aquimarina]|uniref:Lipoprotein n=1 Tax=Paraglaciecola algarum TaxID=3050085 RepID=A0ABS9D622_9ALTE|nr:hypothetical protein [Paraglaciecola sp. G1-23]MCF2947880.1 hypothetical protein [Paraglaciecola sp. G1-23]
MNTECRVKLDNIFFKVNGFSVVLSGCGGGSSSSPAATTPPTIRDGTGSE